jgi:hypothetical protein
MLLALELVRIDRPPFLLKTDREPTARAAKCAPGARQ